MRIVLDSNVIIASFATRGLCSDVMELCFSEHEILLSKPLLQEIHKAFRKKLNLPEALAREIEKFLISESEITVASKVPNGTCRDRSDHEVLGIAIAGKADAIVTGDNDLLSLTSYRSVPILSPKEFWQFLQKKSKENP